MGMYLVSNIEYPASQYEPLAPEVNGVYHEDREVNLSGAVGASQMYRTYNAKFIPSSNSWQIQTPGLPAYATVQNADGSIHYFTLNATTGLWEGSGNNTVYNALDFGMVPTTVSPTFDNGPVFQNMFNTVIDAGGGTIVIPSGKYNFASGVSHTAISPEDSGVLIVGTGGGAELSANFASNETLFSFADFSTTGNGIRFHNLRLTNASPSTVTAIGISLSVCLNITCDEVYFYNWSQAFATDAASGQCGLVDCTVQYVSGQTGQTMVLLQGSQDFVRNCVIMENTGGPAGCYGIEIGGTNGIYIDDVHISDFDIGLKLTDSLRDSFISNTLIDAQVCAVQIMPTTNAHKINNICFSNCVFAENQTTGGSGQTGNSGVVITTNGGTDSNVTGIVFSNCIAYGWGAAGIEIDYGQDIVISGGQFSSNGQSSNAPASLRAGIAIAGGTLITISGVDCSGVNQLWQDKHSGAMTQPAGISISNNPTSPPAISDVVITGCNLQGNATTGHGALITQSGNTISTVLFNACNVSGYGSSSGAISVTGTPSGLQITNCAGYNDQNTDLNGGTPPTTSALSASSCSTPYYGPSIVLFSNEAMGTWTPLTVSISGPSYSMGFGSIYLARPYDQIQFAGTMTPQFVFHWVGK